MDIKLHYVEKGCGMPMVLLHGNGESSEYFTCQINYFAARYRVLAVDTRGHGRSPRGDKDFTLMQFAEDLKYFLDEKRIQKAIILGFSDGGNIALLFTLKYQRYVEALILNGANFHPGGVKKKYQIPICMVYGGLLVLSVFSKKALRKKEQYELMVNQPNIPLKALSRITRPVLVIVGSRDMITASHSRLMSRNIKRSQFVSLKGDHFIAFKKSKQFNKAVEQFLDRQNE